MFSLFVLLFPKQLRLAEGTRFFLTRNGRLCGEAMHNDKKAWLGHTKNTAKERSSFAVVEDK